MARTGHSDQLHQEEATADLLVAEILPWLPDDLLIEILTRLPAKPVHRFKCVSKQWRDLISNPHLRKRLPQALAGFIYWTWADEDGYAVQFINASGRGPPVVDHTSIVVLDCCNGLLLLGSGSDSQPHDYVVCNLATEKWVTLPDYGVTEKFWFSVLAFDPAVSSHFHVLDYVGDGAVWIYSSLTGGWSQSHTVLGFLRGATDHVVPDTVFLNSVLHFLAHELVARAVNLETKEWRDIELPDCDHNMFIAFLGQSQGCLVYTTVNLVDGHEISVWTLEDYGSGEWVLKHSLSGTQLLRRHWPAVFVLHPERNMVFYDCDENGSEVIEVIKSYDVDRGQLRRVAAPVETDTPGDRLLLYVPFFGDMPDVGQSSELN